jgi:tetratricopeptide (TPR) repeat protein
MKEGSLQNRQYEEASADLEQLDIIFSNLNRLDVSDQLLHICTLVASARICHMRAEFGGAIQVWDVALRHARSYNSFEGEGFTCSAIYLSRSLAYLELGEHERAESSFKCGKAILDRGARDYWIPTSAVWVTEILQKLQSIARSSVIFECSGFCLHGEHQNYTNTKIFECIQISQSLISARFYTVL